MSLSSALLTAKSSLAATSKQTSVVSRNIAGVNDPDYSRRTASLASGPYGSLYVNISRSADEALFNRFIQSNSTASNAKAAGEVDTGYPVEQHGIVVVHSCRRT